MDLVPGGSIETVLQVTQNMNIKKYACQCGVLLEAETMISQW